MSTTADQAIYAVLSAYTDLTTLLSPNVSAGGPGIYDTEAPQGALAPMLVCQLIAAVPQTTHGEGSTDARLDMVHMQLTAIDASAMKCSAILYQARVALETGLPGCIQTGEASLPRDDKANCHGRTADFLCWNYPDT